MTRATRKQIEGVFYAYEELKYSSRTELQDLAESGMAVKYDTVRVSGGMKSSKVETAALKLSNNARWCLVVENVMTRFRFGVEYEIIAMKYLHKKSDVQSYLLLHLPERTYYFLVDRIIEEAAQWAIEFGLISQDALLS